MTPLINLTRSRLLDFHICLLRRGSLRSSSRVIFRVRLILRRSSMILRHYWDAPPPPPPPPEHPGPGHPLLGLPFPLSPIHSVPSGDSASDDVGDAGLLAPVLGPLSIGAMSGSLDLSFYSAIDSPAGFPQAGSRTPIPRWRLAREGPFLSELG